MMKRFFDLIFRPFFVLTGFGTALISLYAFWAEWAVARLAKLAFLQEYTIIVQHWGIMVGLMGVFMMAAAFRPGWRNPILIYSALEKSFEEFEKIVKDWVATAKHPATKRLYTEMVYQPMLELLTYLRANGFKTFIVSGGGIEFMRPWTEKVYGIPPEQVIGSSIKTKFELREGKPVLVRLPEINFIDDKTGKPIGIQQHIGRRPVAAFGNSNGDLQMLQWTAAGNGLRFCLYVHHTDGEREWAYDRQSSIGRLDQGLDEAKQRGWTVVDMKQDWKIIYAFQK